MNEVAWIDGNLTQTLYGPSFGPFQVST